MAKPIKVFLLESVVVGAGEAAKALEPGKVHSIDGDVAASLIASGAARKPNADVEANHASEAKAADATAASGTTSAASAQTTLS